MFKKYKSNKLLKIIKVKKIAENKIYMEDKRVFELYKVIPVNYLLTDDSERKLLLKRLQMAMNAIQSSVQMLCINREASIEDYLDVLNLTRSDKVYKKELEEMFKS